MCLHSKSGISVHSSSVIIQNGTVIVQVFISLASFLLSYNLLVHSEKNPEKLTLKNMPMLIYNRYMRLTPVIMLMVGLGGTWWVHIGSGAQWSLVVEETRHICRDKWWSHLLYINNLIKPDDKCLVQSWFMAVDMQVYVVAAFLVLWLGKQPRTSLPFLSFFYTISIALNFAINYHYSYVPVVQLSHPEYLRVLYRGSDSFNWMYMAPWTSLPASILGIINAFLHYSLQQAGAKPAQNKWVRLLYRTSVPAALVWVACGYFIRYSRNVLLLAWYATFDRLVFNIIINFAIFGYFNQVDSMIWKFLSWRGWQILGRMSLSVMMIHWFFSSTDVAIHTTLFDGNLYSTFINWLVTVICAYVCAVPVHVLVEVPLHQMLT